MAPYENLGRFYRVPFKSLFRVHINGCLCVSEFLTKLILNCHSKASRYTASSCMDHDNARFWIGSKKIWDAQIYLAKNLSCKFFFDVLAFALLSNSTSSDFELHEFSIPPKTWISRPYCIHFQWKLSTVIATKKTLEVCA